MTAVANRLFLVHPTFSRTTRLIRAYLQTTRTELLKFNTQKDSFFLNKNN
jgi:hypothetical protein